MKSQTLHNCNQIVIALITGATLLECKINDLKEKKNICVHDPEETWQLLIDMTQEDLNNVENAKVAMRDIQNSLQLTIAKELGVAGEHSSDTTLVKPPCKEHRFSHHLDLCIVCGCHADDDAVASTPCQPVASVST